MNLSIIVNAFLRFSMSAIGIEEIYVLTSELRRAQEAAGTEGVRTSDGALPPDGEGLFREASDLVHSEYKGVEMAATAEIRRRMDALCDLSTLVVAEEEYRNHRELSKIIQRIKEYFLLCPGRATP